MKSIHNIILGNYSKKTELSSKSYSYNMSQTEMCDIDHQELGYRLAVRRLITELLEKKKGKGNNGAQGHDEKHN